jgi:hypothetical protein|tara:strand:- start:131 stop:883 length:753 start_codon:yes stop_codon:yes gene_type:complete
MIYVNGCSYTFGIGTVPHGDAPEPCLKNSWPSQLGDMLDTEVVNEALPGSCNDRIYRDTINYLSNNNPDLVIVMWSDPGRMEAFIPKEGDWYKEIFDLYQITPQSVNSISSYFHREALESWYSFLHTDEKANLNTLTHMNAIQMICKARGIPYISHCYKSNIERQVRHCLSRLENTTDVTEVNIVSKLKSLTASLDELNYGVNNTESFNQYVVDNYLTFSEYSLGHPSYESHTFMANWFKELIEKNDFTC